MRKPSRLPSFAAAAVGVALAAGAALFGAPAAFAQNYGLGGIECGTQRVITYGTGSASAGYRYYDHYIYTNSGQYSQPWTFYHGGGSATFWTTLEYPSGAPVRGTQATYVNTSFNISGSFQACQ